MGEIYLDNSATTKVIPEALEAVCAVCTQDYGNPSSLHGKGHSAEKVVRQTREDVASLLACRPEEVFFTSGGTESNNWAILGSALRRSRRGKHVITTKIEHPSVINTCKHLENIGFEVDYISVDSSGVVDLEELRSCLRNDTVLVSVMHVNNETGAIQPVESIGPLVKTFNQEIVFHVDGVQSFGKLPLDLEEAAVDLFSVSAHKLHGPKGTGALFIKRGTEITPLLWGGEQEQRLRAGTENVPGIAGFGAAVRWRASRSGAKEQIAVLKNHLIDKLQQQFPDMLVNGSLEKALPYIVNVSFPGLKGEVLVHTLEQYGIFVSTGSACHSRGGQASHVLEAMGVSPESREGAIRLSFSSFNTLEEVDFAADKLAEAVRDLYSLR